MITLFSAQTGSVSTSTAIRWPGGFGTFAGWGTWKGGTLALKAAFPTSTSLTYITVGSDVTLTANGMGNFQLAPCMLRAVVTGASSVATSITAVIS